MRGVVVGCTFLWLLVGAGPAAFARKTGRPSFDSAYGPAVSGLRLAARVDSAGTVVRFRVKNQGARTVVINVRFSCSGYSHWWLKAGNQPSKLSTMYVWSAAKRGLERSTRVKPSVCTVNVPTRAAAIKPGQVAVVKIPVAKGVKRIAQRYLQGLVGLHLTVHKHVQLKTGIARRLTP